MFIGSFKKNIASAMVNTGPNVPIIEANDAPSLAIASASNKIGITVDNNAIQILNK